MLQCYNNYDQSVIMCVTKLLIKFIKIYTPFKSIWTFGDSSSSFSFCNYFYPFDPDPANPDSFACGCLAYVNH